MKLRRVAKYQAYKQINSAALGNVIEIGMPIMWETCFG
jgi:hypothetical protein